MPRLSNHTKESIKKTSTRSDTPTFIHHKVTKPNGHSDCNTAHHQYNINKELKQFKEQHRKYNKRGCVCYVSRYATGTVRFVTNDMTNTTKNERHSTVMVHRFTLRFHVLIPHLIKRSMHKTALFPILLLRLTHHKKKKKQKRNRHIEKKWHYLTLRYITFHACTVPDPIPAHRTSFIRCNYCCLRLDSQQHKLQLSRKRVLVEHLGRERTGPDARVSVRRSINTMPSRSPLVPTKRWKQPRVNCTFFNHCGEK